MRNTSPFELIRFADGRCGQGEYYKNTKDGEKEGVDARKVMEGKGETFEKNEKWKVAA